MNRFGLVVGLLLLGSFGLGCTDATAVMLVMRSSGVSAPSDVDQLRVEVSTSAGMSANETLSISDWSSALTYAIRPGTAASNASMTVTVVALKDGVEVMRKVRETSFSEGSTKEVELVFEALCLGLCPGQSCENGVCGAVPTDGGVDAGLDGGLDGGPGTDGGLDGGPLSDGAIDGGTDAGSDGGTDAGFDSGYDAGFDSGYDAGFDSGYDAGFDAGPVSCSAVSEGAACVGALVISEVATGGPTGGTDEFVEVYNTTGHSIDLAGLTVGYASSSSSSFSTRATAASGATIPAHGFYLFASANYSRSPAGDGGGWGSSQGLSGTGGHVRIEAGGTTLDLLGWGSAVNAEGGSAAAVSTDSSSMERKANASSDATSLASGGADASAGNGYDTDNNGADFVVQSSPNPQNTASTPEP